VMPPAPLEWHPWYRDKTHLLDWLERGQQHNYLVPVSRRARFCEGGSVYPDTISCAALTKRRAFGLAPYVGRPFVYTWWIATDQQGRSIAGGSRIEYLP
jgi:hypothetical protein